MMSRKNKVVILVSNTGTGTNLQAIIDAVRNGKINAEIVAVISDKPDAPALEKAKQSNLNIEICPKKEALLSLLEHLNPDFICLAGWKQIIPNEVILKYPNKILNLHPGLIPDNISEVVKNPDGTDALWNKGMLAEKAIQKFLDKKSTYAGSSVHFLTLNFDFGPVLGRTFVEVLPNDNVLSLYGRLKQKENNLYADVLAKLTNE
jgi:phosphoribosylglycinamide formyltransferase-1